MEVILTMREQKDISIAIIRMDKLLADIISKIRDYAEKCGAQGSPLIREIENFLEFFKTSIITRMKRTPEAERLHNISMRNSRTKIKEILTEIKSLQGIFDGQSANFEMFLGDITANISDEEELMNSIKKISNIEIPNEKKESVSKILIVKEQAETRKKVLKSEIDLLERKLVSILEFHAATEKKLFDTCAKLEQDYKTLLAKYDHDISASHILLEDLSKDRNAINAKRKDIEDQLIVQRVLYIQFRKEREIALMKAFTEKLELFKQTRAAKIIQRTWRIYLERISIKKRRKPRKK